jgi:hypothetical protein
MKQPGIPVIYWKLIVTYPFSSIKIKVTFIKSIKSIFYILFLFSPHIFKKVHFFPRLQVNANVKFIYPWNPIFR